MIDLLQRDRLRLQRDHSGRGGRRWHRNDGRHRGCHRLQVDRVRNLIREEGLGLYQILAIKIFQQSVSSRLLQGFEDDVLRNSPG